MAEFSHMLAVRMFHTAKNRTVGDALLGLLNRKLPRLRLPGGRSASDPGALSSDG